MNLQKDPSVISLLQNQLSMIKHLTGYKIYIFWVNMLWKSQSYIVFAVMTMAAKNAKLTSGVVVKKSFSRILYSDIIHMQSDSEVWTVCKSKNWNTTERLIWLKINIMNMCSTCTYREIDVILWSRFQQSPVLQSLTSPKSNTPFRITIR